MQTEKATVIFDLVLKEKMLPQKLDDLMPLSFIGQTAVNFYRGKIKMMDQLKMTEEQRETTLKDGQQAGVLLLDIEARIGEIALSEPRAKSIVEHKKGTRGIIGTRPSGQQPKHDRLMMTEKKMQQSQKIAQNPEIVARVKAKAIENEDIPTKTAVLSEISYEKEKERRKKAEETRTESKTIVALDQQIYINKLSQCIRLLPQKPPKNWNEQALKEATALANIIIKRLEVFNES